MLHTLLHKQRQRVGFHAIVTAIGGSMRRVDRQQSEAFGKRILDEAPYGILSLVDHDGTPYAIPISFVRSGQTIYLHGASEGKKLDIIAEHDQVAFTCVGKTQVLPESFTTNYESVVTNGSARIVDDPEEKRKGLLLLAKKYSSSYMEKAKKYVESSLDETSVVAITITTISAKARIPKQEEHHD